MGKFKAFVVRFFRDKRVRFLIVGGLNTIVGVGVTWIVYLCFGVSLFSEEELVWYVYLTGTLLGQIIGTIHSYFWNKYFTFRSKERSGKEFLKFVLVYAVQYGINLGLTALLNKLISIPALVTILTTIVCTVLSYLGHNFFSFRKKRAANAPAADGTDAAADAGAGEGGTDADDGEGADEGGTDEVEETAACEGSAAGAEEGREELKDGSKEQDAKSVAEERNGRERNP